jgi:hypothetical protein
LVGLLREAVLCLPAALTVYLGLKQQGPWRWLVDVQLWLFNGYYRSYTIGACVFLLLAVTTGIHKGLSRAGWPARPVVGFAVKLVLDGWSGLPKVLAVALFVGAAVLGIGLWQYIPARLAGPRTEVSAADLEAGERPASRWLVVQGRALVEKPVVWSKRGTEEERAVCLVSERWQANEPVAVILSARTAEPLPHDSAPTKVEGMATVIGVPGLIRSSFEQDGLKVADGALYVEVGNTPEKANHWGILAAVGASAVLLCVVVGLVRGAWNRRTNAG